MGRGRQARRSTTKKWSRIAARRAEQVITQRQAAAATGIPFWTYQRLESGALTDPGIRLVVNAALGLRNPDEDLWAALAAIWELHWPQWSLLTTDDLDELPDLNRLRWFREKAGKTQLEIIAAVGLSERGYRLLESGKPNNPKIADLVGCANFLDVSLHEVCEERWLTWMVFARNGATGPGDLDQMRAEGVTLLESRFRGGYK